MMVKFYPTKKTVNSVVADFLMRHKVSYEMIRPEEVARYKSHLYKTGDYPVLEVDGQVFINPNDDALKKIFSLA
ncbi:MAG TPA: hypothetical protein VHL58_03940 [Thermoanaerobaculia bacterium]|nr:hypothetical protein [Thermoanaerobaculia bacterium]